MLMGSVSLARLHRYIRLDSRISWAILDQGMVSAVNFLTGILLARHLGVEEFGRFTLVWMLVLFMSSFQLALIVSPMLSIGPKRRQRLKLLP